MQYAKGPAAVTLRLALFGKLPSKPQSRLHSAVVYTESLVISVNETAKPPAGGDRQ